MNHRRAIKHKLKVAGIITACILGCAIAIDLIGYVFVDRLIDAIHTYEPIGSEQVHFIDDETGYWTFESNDGLKVLQLTDLHIGGGLFSIKEDYQAVEAVYSLIETAKPDLIILTGDMTYPMPFESATINNKRSARIVAELLERSGISWTLVFGNHDYEAFSLYNQQEISDFYLMETWENCLYEPGDSDVDGLGNYVINIQDSSGIMTHSLYLLDSHAYVAESFLGLDQKYDNIHQNQVDWYKGEVERLDKINSQRGGDWIPSSMYFHIPLPEYLDAWTEYSRAGGDTEDVSYDFGFASEPEPIVFCGLGEDNMFEQILETNHTSSIFVGHDHLNTFSLIYKGVRLTYGMSIDYTAYPGIDKKTEQRGATLISIDSEGSIGVEQILLEP